MVHIKLKRVREAAILPNRQTEGSAGMDLHACIEEPLAMAVGERLIVPVGIALELPAGLEAQIRARSGLAAKYGIGLVNGVGTIDSDYRGEISVIVINWGDEPFVVEPNVRIAQMVIARHETVEWDVATELAKTQRGTKKFGSTGH